MRKIYSFMVVALCVLCVSCGTGVRSTVKRGEIIQTIEGDAIRGKYVEVIGIGAADQAIQNTTQRKATSRNAAIVAAQYDMLSLVKGLQVEGGVTIEKAMETDSRISTHVDDVIKAAQVVKTEWTADDGCVVTLRLSKKDIEEKMGVKIK